MSGQDVREEVTGLLTRIATLIRADSSTFSSGTPGDSGVQRRTPVAGPGMTTTSSALPSTPTSVLAEMRNRFAPYDRTRLAGRSAQGARRGARLLTVRDWTHRFLCLSSPRDNTTPLSCKKVVLRENGLGDAVITTAGDASSSRLSDEIRITFPKLVGNEFELLRAVGAGHNKPIMRISNHDPVPPVSYLKAASLGIIFIRPLDHIELEGQGMMAEFQRPARASNGGSGQMELETNSQQDCTVQDDDLVEGTDGITTIDKYREQLYAENPGMQLIGVMRENFLEQVLGVYKDPSFNYLAKPKVQFFGEPGADVGALTREFFWKGLLALYQEKIDGKILFEGAADHKVPSTDSRLIRSGIYKTVGKFIGHAIIHCGIGFLGLSEAVVQYLTMTGVADCDSPFTVCIEDIPDIEIREGLHQMLLLKGGATPTEENLAKAQAVASTFDFNETLNGSNAVHAVEHILYQAVIERRRPCLEAMKMCIAGTGILALLESHPYLVSGVFPRTADITYPAQLVIDRIRCDGSEIIFGFVEQFIRRISHETGKVQALLSSWTGWPILPEGYLEIKVEDGVDFQSHTCFNQLEIPSSFTEMDLNTHLNLLVDYGAAGFGST